jgi:hypothetical protein
VSDLDVSGPRPLAEAARMLEQRFKRVATYEDTLYVHPDDTIRDQGRIVPRGGRISIQYADADDLASVLDRSIDAYARANLPGAFDARHQGEVHHIVPRSFRSDRGETVARLPLLDETIVIPAQERDGLQLVEEIIHRVGAARNETINVGTVPTNALVQQRAGGALSGKASDLLLDLFRGIGRSYSWQLLNQPGTREFVLNIHDVPMR